MAEIIQKKGKKYNIFDKINQVWNQCSFWTHADDVEFDDGKTASTKLSAINGITSDLSGEAEDIAASIKCVNQLNSSLDETKKSVSDGKSSIASAITNSGVTTAADATFDTMATNISTVAMDRYNIGFNGGRLKGHDDVTNSPNDYGLYSQAQYDSALNAGASAAASNVCVYAAVTNGGSGSNVAYDKNLFSVSGGTVVCKRSGNYQILKGGYGCVCTVKKTVNGSTSYALSDGVAIGTCWMNANDYFTVTNYVDSGGNCSFVCIFAV